MSDEKVYQVALCMTSNVGYIMAKQLVSYCGSAKGVFQKKRSFLAKIPGVGPSVINAVTTSKHLIEAEDEVKKAEKSNTSILFYTDKAYPNRLKQISDSPPLIYVNGNVNLNHPKIISIVGTRNATEYGKDVTSSIVNELIKYQPLIVSGLAYGIDITAHRAALKANLPTLGVMASGIDWIYPAVHKETAYKMKENGGLVTEYAFGKKPDPHNFPARNRIIAGIADATIVVEAAAKGGALITAEIAHGYNKEVFAVPGNLNHTYSEGCNRLIKLLKASIYTGIKSIEEALNWDVDEDPYQSVALTNYNPSDFTENEWNVIEMLRANDNKMLMDELAWKTQISISQLASILLNLEFKGIIKSLPGKKFMLK